MDDIIAFNSIIDSKEFYINGHQFCGLSTDHPLSTFFETCNDVLELKNLGIVEYGQIPASDLNDYNTFLTVKLISALAKKNRIVNDFALSQNNDFVKRPQKGRIPIVFQIRNQKYVAKVEASFDIFLEEEMVIGMGNFRPVSIQFEAFELKKRNILVPELWLNPNFPIIPLGLEKNTSIQFSFEDWPFDIE